MGAHSPTKMPQRSARSRPAPGSAGGSGPGEHGESDGGDGGGVGVLAAQAHVVQLLDHGGSSLGSSPPGLTSGFLLRGEWRGANETTRGSLGHALAGRGYGVLGQRLKALLMFCPACLRPPLACSPFPLASRERSPTAFPGSFFFTFPFFFSAECAVFSAQPHDQSSQRLSQTPHI